MLNPIFNVGDVVQLRSGGPLMTVLGVGTSNNNIVTCLWFSSQLELKQGSFNRNVLRSTIQSISIVPRSPTMKVSLTKKSKVKVAAVKAKVGAAIVAFNIQDNENDSFTVFGIDAAGNQADISGVATLTVTSDDPTILTVSTPLGMTSTMTAVGPLGTTNITAVATWNDGSIGPFTFTLPVTVQAGPVTGIIVVPGTPTVV